MRKGIDPIRVRLMLINNGCRSMKVGRFRDVERTPQGLELKMYDRPIVTIRTTPNGVGMTTTVVTLDLCGFWTQAVVRAMREYGEAIGQDIKPSIAKGRFTAQYRGTIHEADYRNQIHIQTS